MHYDSELDQALLRKAVMLKDLLDVSKFFRNNNNNATTAKGCDSEASSLRSKGKFSRIFPFSWATYSEEETTVCLSILR